MSPLPKATGPRFRAQAPAGRRIGALNHCVTELRDSGSAELCGVHADFRRLDADPDLVAAVESEFAHRRGRDFGNDGWRTLQPDANPVSMQVEVGGPALPDVSRRPVRTRSIEGDSSRMDDREHIAI